MMLILAHAAILGLGVSSIVAADPVVKIEKDQVSYRGTTKGSIEHFQNIRFAHDTSGARRFAPPEPYTPPSGSEIDATAPGAACPQIKAAVPPFFDETPDTSEDCLTLRVSRPFGTTSKDKLPVVVHIYGGGVVKGSAYDQHFDPDNLITLSTSLDKPVIYVAINYRVLIFGFARLPILKDQKSMNVGMRDQRAGYQWIKDNIAAFGGDPERITSFGTSSGGTFTSLHLMTYGGEQGVPFTQGWAMSGPPGTALNSTSEVTELHTRAVAEKLGCSQEEDAEVLQCLRDVPMEQLTDAAVEYSIANHPPLGLFTFIPSTDGDFLRDRQSTLYKSGKFVKGIPMVYGWTEDDGATNAGPAHLFQNEEDIKAPIRSFAHALTDEDYEALFSLYPASDFEEDVANYEARKAESDPTAPVHWFRASRILRDILFTCSSINFGHEMSRQSKALDPNFAGVHLYDFNQTMLAPMFQAAGMPYVGACHGSDSSYVFNGLFPEGEVSEPDQRLSGSMASAFIKFAYTGNPAHSEGEGFKSWPEAFTDSQGLSGRPDAGLSNINLQVIGGPLGTGPSALMRKEADFATAEGVQAPLMGDMEIGENATTVPEARRLALERQKLFERCAFIDTLAEKLGV